MANPLVSLPWSQATYGSIAFTGGQQLPAETLLNIIAGLLNQGLGAIASNSGETTSSATSTIVTSQTAIAAGSAPTFFSLQNLDTHSVFVLYGTGVPSASNFSYILAPDTSADAGYGGQYRDSAYKGQVNLASNGGTINVAVVKG